MRLAQMVSLLVTLFVSSALKVKLLWATGVKTAAATVLSAAAQTNALPAKTGQLCCHLEHALVKTGSISTFSATSVLTAIHHVLLVTIRAPVKPALMASSLATTFAYRVPVTSTSTETPALTVAPIVLSALLTNARSAQNHSS